MGALRRANNMAMALEARGFGMGTAPTSFVEYRMTASDSLALATLIGIGAAYFVIYLTGLGAISPK
jgi:energy-coupling factor transporter transmembrane protein EcfT